MDLEWGRVRAAMGGRPGAGGRAQQPRADRQREAWLAQMRADWEEAAAMATGIEAARQARYDRHAEKRAQGILAHQRAQTALRATQDEPGMAVAAQGWMEPPGAVRIW